MRLLTTGVHRMRVPLRLVGAVLLLVFGVGRASAQAISTYTFSATTGSPTDMSSATTIFGTGVDDSWTGPLNIGFSFIYNNTTYTQFWAVSNGFMGLGPNNPSGSLSGSFQSASFGAPVISALWRDLHTGNDGYVKYLTTGTTGSRILTVEWRVRDYPGSGQPTNTRFQIRLYEGSNRFDIWYGAVSTSGGTIGGWISNSNFGSVSPASNTVSYSVSNNSAVPPANIDRVYAFDLCTVAIAGTPAQGGTLTMANNDSLLTGKSVMWGSSGNFTPFTVTPSGCQPSANLTYALSGVNASEYTITPPSVSVTPGNVSTPTITFSPQGLGPRRATLTVTGPSFSRTYYLGARGGSRIQYTGNVAEGGTATMANGDTLLQNLSIRRGLTAMRSPFTLQNVNGNESTPPASVTYQIRGTSGGQYTIAPSSAALGAGATNTPVITFSPSGIGLIIDTLIVTADGETRYFPLHGFSAAPGIEILVNGERVDSTSELFRNQTSCVGGDYTIYQMQVTNIGADTLRIYGFDVLAIDSVYRQGVPRYPLLQTPEGAYIPRPDYIITEQPPVLPISANPAPWPIELTRLQSKTLYLTFSAQRRNKRFGRAYLYTNAQNAASPNPDGEVAEGLLRFDVYGSGNGGRLAELPTSVMPPKPVVFPMTRLDNSSTATYTLYNSGECDLRVSMEGMNFVSGDVSEFTIDSMPGRIIDATTNDLLIPAGDSDRIVVRFTPHQQGSRRASLRLQTNDSMQGGDGVVGRGTHYVDFYGYGSVGLYAKDHDFGEAVIDGGAADQPHGTVSLENTRLLPMRIDSLLLEGTDVADFAGVNWPALPFNLDPGKRIDLEVAFAPKSPGTAGPRTAVVRMVSSTGESVFGVLHGVAGTRTIQVTPLQLNFATVNGRVSRQTVTIQNMGTMPLKLDMPTQPGGDFSISGLPRLELAPGQVEYLEVLYTPAMGAPSTSDTAITISSNGTNGVQVVMLHGTATRAERGIDSDPAGAIGRSNVLPLDAATTEFNVSGVAGVRDASGLALMQSVPNPARDRVEISYILPQQSAVTLALYDAEGNLVRVLDEGTRGAGQSHVRVDVSDLASGVYHYRLTANGHVLNRALTVAR